jgi:ABC-type molybdate transport system substrate-binding protein
MRTPCKHAAPRGFASLLAAITIMIVPASAADPVLLHAAGSLRLALTDVIAAYEPTAGVTVRPTFGASGTLKDAIAKGERAQVFASANMEHPQALADAKKSGPVVLFARNRLCALVRPGLAVSPATLLDRILDPSIKLATSTPKADPSGDYAWELFRKADKLNPGSFAILEKRALQLIGAPTSATPPKGRVAYAWHIAEGRADIFLTYCTNAMAAQAEVPDQQMVQIPDALAVGADYGMTVMADAPSGAYRFAMFILSPPGQKILARHGFSAPGLPQ